jgi:hypothetical protein
MRGGVPNPKELMENRVGGLVNVTRPDAILPLPQTGLNPFVFQTVQLLDEDKEESTGISKLSSGLNKDAISKQNSADMVGQLVSLSQQRQKIVARQFAEGFLKPLWVEVYQLLLENVKDPMEIQVDGEFVEITPAQWSTRKDVEIEFALGYGEKEREAQKYVQVDMMLSADPNLKSLYTLEKRYNTIAKALKASGIKDVTTHLVPPEEADNSPDPITQMQMQMAMKELELKERAQALKEAEFQFKVQKETMAAQLKATHVQVDTADTVATNQREDIQLTHNIQMDYKEMELAEKAEDKRAIYSPDNA